MKQISNVKYGILLLILLDDFNLFILVEIRFCLTTKLNNLVELISSRKDCSENIVILT